MVGGGAARAAAARLVLAVAAGVAIAVAVVGCGAAAELVVTPAGRECDGIPEDIGGCARGQPVFLGDTCDEVASEWGHGLEHLVTRVFAEPAMVDGEPRSERILEAMRLATVRAMRRIDAVGLVGECRADAFLAIAEPAFTPAFRAAVGDHREEGRPVATWDQFVTELRYASYDINAASTESPTPAP